MISIVVPCYNEEEALPYFYKEMLKIIKEMKQEKFELIFVNDGSKDKTLDILKDLSDNDKQVKYISFSRNFGKEAAMLAGLEASKGDYVTIMDADLQDPPHFLKLMYDGIKKGYDCVGLRRATRKGEPKLRSFFAKTYYKIINKISDVKIVDGARDFRLMTRQMVDSILRLKEKNRYSKGLFSFVGFKTKWLEYENVERVAGTTKWSFKKLFLYSMESIISFSSFPLMLSLYFAILTLLASFIFLVIIIVKLCMSLFISPLLILLTVILFLSGIILFTIGIMGLYITRIYNEEQSRPIYIIKETNIK